MLSPAYNLIVSAVLQHRYPPPGRIYKVNGYGMHLYCTGDGAPNVIVEAGLGNDFIAWQKVQPDVAKFTGVYTYGRAVLGWSDDQHPHDAKHIAQQLHALLQAAGENAPIVLVGASAGGGTAPVRLRLSAAGRRLVFPTAAFPTGKRYAERSMDPGQRAERSIARACGT